MIIKPSYIKKHWREDQDNRLVHVESTDITILAIGLVVYRNEVICTVEADERHGGE